MDEIKKLRAAIAAREQAIKRRLEPAQRLVWSRLNDFVYNVPDVFYRLPISDYICRHDRYETCSFHLNGKEYELSGGVGSGFVLVKINGKLIQGQEIFGSDIDELLAVCEKLPSVIQQCNQALELKEEIRAKRELEERLTQEARRLGINLEHLEPPSRRATIRKGNRMVLWLGLSVSVLLIAIILWLR